MARHPSTTTMKLLAAACFVLLVLNVVESRPPVAGSSGGGNNVTTSKKGHHGGAGHHGGGDRSKTHKHKLFVFGDEFVDVGNLAPDEVLGGYSKTWRYPFGMSDAAHGRKPTGRFSDGLVQSDYMAKIMGHRESPPAYNGDGWDGENVDPSGINFAVGGSGVLQTLPNAAPEGTRVATLHAQVRQLRDLVSDGVIDEDKDFEESVALITFSGNDYAQVRDADGFDGLMPRVVDELAAVVSQLQDMGVTKVVVSTLPPFGCSPWLARDSNYTACQDGGNDGPAKHNAALRDRLDGDDDVMVLDVYTVMMDMVAPPPQGSELSSRFKERLQPCCESYDEVDNNYCGNPNGNYWLCDRPEDSFYWDFVSPTQAGWRAVMQMLQGPIMAFLGISQLNHF